MIFKPVTFKLILILLLSSWKAETSELKLRSVNTRAGLAKLYVLDNGPDAPIMLFAPGASANGRSGFSLMQKFYEKGFSATAINFPGIGYSSERSDLLDSHGKSGRFLDLPEYVQSLRDVVEALVLYGVSLNSKRSRKPLILVGHSFGTVVITYYLAGLIPNERMDDFSFEPREQARIARDLVLGAALHGTAPQMSLELAHLVQPLISNYELAKWMLGPRPNISTSHLQFLMGPTTRNPFAKLTQAVVGTLIDVTGTASFPERIGKVKIENFRDNFQTPEGRKVLKNLMTGAVSNFSLALATDLHTIGHLSQPLGGELNPLLPIVSVNGNRDGTVDERAQHRKVEMVSALGNPFLFHFVLNEVGHLANPLDPFVIDRIWPIYEMISEGKGAYLNFRKAISNVQGGNRAVIDVKTGLANVGPNLMNLLELHRLMSQRTCPRLLNELPSVSDGNESQASRN